MGAVLSALKTLPIAIKLLLEANKDLQELLRRASQAPGLPNPHPTESYWLEDPPYPELVNAQSPELPAHADIVIIGSGITAAAVAWSILQQHTASSGQASADDKASKVPRIVVLEARSLCSGATGRNGGHIKPDPSETFASLRKKFGPAKAAEIVRFQLRHVELLPELCLQQGWDAAECRKVETCDMYVSEEKRDESFAQVRELKKWVPEVVVNCLSSEEAQEKLHVNHMIQGAITYTAGALWPFRFVSSVWKTLKDKFPDCLFLETHTAAVSVSSVSTQTIYPYQVITQRGNVNCKHVVHATNAFAGEHIPGFRGKLTGIIAHMTAQRPGKNFPSSDGNRSWSVIYGGAFDYVSQRPGGKDGEPGDVMLGGGFDRSDGNGMSSIGIWDDAKVDPLPMAHLNGIFPTIFEPNWSPDDDAGRLKKSWTGILAFVGDMMPFVGRLDPALTGRRIADRRPDSGRGVAPGEWVSAGYCGDGMVWAWLCGTALGAMITGTELEDVPATPGRPAGAVAGWLPRELLVTPSRVKKANLEGLVERLA